LKEESVDYKVEFDVNDGTKPERLLAEAEVVFDGADGPFAGLKLVGFSVWRSESGGTYVTLPARAFGAGQERRYFDYIRATSGVHEAWRKARPQEAAAAAEREAGNARRKE
jgi:hypothetical protein